jgi:hypothetical protein
MRTSSHSRIHQLHMAYSQSFEIPIEGRGGALFPATVNFSQIFTGVPLFYHGSVVQVQEILTIFTEIFDERLVDINYEYFTPKKFLGNWQANGLATTPFNHEDAGLLWEEEQQIKRYSTYTITANPNQPQTLADGGTINQCNFQLIGAEVGTPLGSISAQEPFKSKDIFNIENYRKPATLADTPYNQKLGSCGFYVSPGARIYKVRQDISIINDIYIADIAWTPRLCELGEITCDQALVNYLQNPEISNTEIAVCTPPPGSPLSYQPESFTWICPTDSTFIRTLWRCVPIIQ